MFEPEDLDEAEKHGVLFAGQADQLKRFLKRRDASKTGTQVISDEPFYLFRGLHEIFISLGLVLLVGGFLVGRAGVNVLTLSFDNDPATDTLGRFITVVFVGLLAEYFTRKKRFKLPSLVLCAFFTYFLGRLLQDLSGEFLQSQYHFVFFIAGTVLFYGRHKLPFALGLGAYIGVYGVLSLAMGQGFEALTWDHFMKIKWFLFFYGLVVFVFAMFYDTKDPKRLTRFSMNGFWLHLVAAPMIIHPLAIEILVSNIAYPQSAFIYLVVFCSLVIVLALFIDRRAMVVSSFVYLAVVIGYGSVHYGSGFISVSYTFFILGAVVLVLSVFWSQIRYRLMRRFAFIGFLHRLPPYEK